MKYLLDVVLIVGLVWMGYLWNGQKKAGLGLNDELDKLKANVARLELDLDQARQAGSQASADLLATQARLEQASQDLLEKTDALSAKTEEAEELLTAAKALKARVDELQGYKDGAKKAIVAVLPEPVAP